MTDRSTSPSNHFKYCPRCAALGYFDSRKNSFECKTCGFHFFLNAASAVAAIIFDTEHRILVVRRGIEPSKGMLDLPGGFVDPGENAEQALIRELKEELNVSPVSIKYFASFPNQYLFSGFFVSTVDLVFICEVSSFEGLKSLDDVSEVIFLKIDEIDLEQFAFHSAKNILKKLISE